MCSIKKRMNRVYNQVNYLTKNCSSIRYDGQYFFDSWKSSIEKGEPKEEQQKHALNLFNLFLSKPIPDIKFVALAKNLDLQNCIEKAKEQDIMQKINVLINFPININLKARILSFYYKMDFKKLFEEKVRKEIELEVKHSFDFDINCEIGWIYNLAERYGKIEFLKETVKSAIKNELERKTFFALKNTKTMHSFANKLELQEFLDKELNIYCISLIYEGGSNEYIFKKTDLFDALKHIYGNDLTTVSIKLRELSNELCDFIKDIEPKKAEIIKERVKLYIDHEEYMSKLRH